jgi:hypothetical protein
MELGKVIRELEVEFDEELIPPFKDGSSQPPSSPEPQTPTAVPI